MRERELFAEFEKCEFWLDRVSVLSHVFYKDGISINPNKVEVVVTWKGLMTVTKFIWSDECEHSYI